jgi:hypothetical protein
MSAARRQHRGPSPLPDHPIVTRHQRFIRSLPCVSCGKPAPSECASVGMRSGLGILPGHRDLVPLCGPETVWQDCCHSRKHYRGAVRFWSELSIDPLDLARQLWLVSGNVTAGFRAVMRARQAAIAAHQRRNGREPKRSLPRSALDRGAALRDQPRPIAMVTAPTSPELPLYWDSRS